MKPKIVLFGGGGHAKVVADIIIAENIYELAGIVDSKFATGSIWNNHFSVVSLEEGMKIGSGIIAIGDNLIRSNISQEILAKNPQFNFVSAIHPTAVLGSSVVIGKGTVVMPLCAINANSKIGDHVIINTRAVVEHDCDLGNFSFVAPGAVLGGNVAVGQLSMIGMNASIKQGVKIGANTVIGMGANLLRDAQTDFLYINQGGVATIKSPRKSGERFF